MNILEKTIENIGEIFDLLASNFLKISLSVAIFSWLGLFLPQNIFEYFGVSLIRNDYTEILGITAIVSTYLVILWLTYRGISILYSYVRAIFELPLLTKAEAKRLNQFLVEESQTSTFFQTDGVIDRLEKKGFIYRSNARPNSVGEIDYHIYTWMFRRLKNNPSILKSKIKSEENDE